VSALPPVPNVLRIEFHFTIGTDVNALVRWHAAYTGTAPSDATCNAIAEAIWNYANSQWASFMCDSTKLTGVKVQDLSSATAGIGEWIADVVGTRGSGQIGAGMAVLVNGHIGRRYRGGKPRSYFPFGIASDITDEQDWGASLVSNTTTIVNGMVTAIEAISISGTICGSTVNVSYYEGVYSTPSPTNPARYINRPLKRVTPVVDVITTWTAKARIGSQRRRYLQRG